MWRSYQFSNQIISAIKIFIQSDVFAVQWRETYNLWSITDNSDLILINENLAGNGAQTN